MHTHIILLSVFEIIFLRNKSYESGMENTNDEIKSFLEKLRLQNSVLKKLLDIFQNAEVIDIEEEIHTDEKEDTDIVKKDKK